MVDQEAEVRKEAYLKLVACGIKIEHFQSPETKLLIIKEGMTDQDPGVATACLQFLAQSIVHEQEVTISIDELDARVKSCVDVASRRRKSALIKSRRNSDASEMHTSETVTLTKKVYSFSKFLRAIDIKYSFIKEHFQQAPFIVLGTFFKIVNSQATHWMTLSEDEELQAKVKQLNDFDSELIVSNYARALMRKFKHLAGCSMLDMVSDPFQNFEVDPVLINFEEVIFIRLLYEFSKW